MNKVQFFFLIFFLSVIKGEILSELGSYERNESINGNTFKCKMFFDDEEIMKDFFVNNERVSEEIYHTRKHEAYDNEFQQAQDQLKHLYEEQNGMYMTLCSKAYIALLKDIKKRIEKVVQSLQDPSLRAFLAFDEETVSGPETLHYIQGDFLPVLIFVDDIDAVQEEPATLKKLFELCEEVYTKLTSFYKISIESAIDKAEDPTDLKKLLELI